MTASNTAVQLAPQQQQKQSLVVKFAQRYSVDATKLMDTLKATAFKQPNNGAAITDQQMMALLIVADQYGLNPFTKEVYAFPAKGGGIVPVVGVDGWARIINEHPQFDGLTFDWPNDDGTCCVCTIYRKDRAHPIAVPEYLAECKRSTEPWGSHPRRMLRHKALIQCARVAFGFAGIYDPDEAKRIEAGGYIDGDTGEIIEGTPSKGLAAVRAAANNGKAKPAAKVVERVQEVEPEQVAKDPDDPSAGRDPDEPQQQEGTVANDLPRTLPMLSARARASRIGLIQRSKTREDAINVVDELRGDVHEDELTALMTVVNSTHPVAV